MAPIKKSPAQPSLSYLSVIEKIPSRDTKWERSRVTPVTPHNLLLCKSFTPLTCSGRSTAFLDYSPGS
ncbi:hypothetical protein EVAR_93611_1 [Eumeta japonica]|uniref:Uncharacterized protein n=1 Tax=Eumeta variegata TaxID=151549 RepID=A0A4C1TQI1_EUMVA|nr:hypothetical protein EVAR_93611_1 [Eumeta japonica]